MEGQVSARSSSKSECDFNMLWVILIILFFKDSCNLQIRFQTLHAHVLSAGGGYPIRTSP